MSARLGLEGRSALVTAGMSHSGRACVGRLRQEGMAVAFTDSDREGGAALAAETGALFLEWDPLDRAACDSAVSQALEATGARLDVLVTNAARCVDGPLESTPEPVVQDLLEANLTAAFRAARACFGPMQARGGGSMIHVASAAGIRAVHETAAYSVAAAGVIALAELFASSKS